MPSKWIGRCALNRRCDMMKVLQQIDPNAYLDFFENPIALREFAAQQGGEQSAAIVGLSDSGVSDENLAAALVKDGCVSPVILLVDHASGSLRSRARRAGIDQVIDLHEFLPQEKLGLSRDQLLDATKANPSDTTKLTDDRQVQKETVGNTNEDLAPMFCFASGRGGVGKTAIASVFASLAARHKIDVAFVDLDLSCGNAFAALGVKQMVDLNRICANGNPTKESMGRSCAKSPVGVNLWGPCEKPELAETIMPHIGTLLNYLRRRFDLVVCDTSTTFTDATAEAVQNCTRLFLVFDNMRGAIAPLTRASKLAQRLGLVKTRIVRLENFVEPHPRKRLADEPSLEANLSYQIFDGGLEDSDLLAAGKIDELLDMGGPFVDSVDRVLTKTLAELGIELEFNTKSSSKQHKSFLARLIAKDR